MLAFRSEAHAQAWCHRQGLARGAVFPLETCWQLARAWYGDRLLPGWRRRTPEEAEHIFAGLGLTGAFWRLQSARPGHA